MEFIKLINKQELENQQRITQELNEVFENLEEGILILKDKQISYSNQIFKDVLDNVQIEMKGDQTDQDILDLKILKVYVNKETSNSDSKQYEKQLEANKGNQTKSEEAIEPFDDQQMFSLRDIIFNSQRSMKHKVFEISYKGRKCDLMKYALFKVKKI